MVRAMAASSNARWPASGIVAVASLWSVEKETVMVIKPPAFEELTQKLRELAETGPLRDFEKNAKLLLASMFERMDLVTREEFEALRESLLHTRQELAKLHERVARLEAKLGDQEGEGS